MYNNKQAGGQPKRTQIGRAWVNKAKDGKKFLTVRITKAAIAELIKCEAEDLTLVGFFNLNKNNPKAPDINFYESAPKEQSSNQEDTCGLPI